MYLFNFLLIYCLFLLTVLYLVSMFTYRVYTLLSQRRSTQMFARANRKYLKTNANLKITEINT